MMNRSVRREEGEAELAPLIARVLVARDTFWGTTIDDPYRWMEDWCGEALGAWMEAQAVYTREYLSAVPERAALLARITELDEATPSLVGYALASTRTFYLRRDSDGRNAKLVMRRSAHAQEEVLIDPEGDADAKVGSCIDWYCPSADGCLVAYGVSSGGSEQSILHVLESDTGRILDEAIGGTMFGQLTWLAGGHAFLYHRLAQQDAATDSYHFRDSCTYFHRLGDDPEYDVPVFGNGINPRIQLSPVDFPVISVRPGSRWMIGSIIHGVRPEMTLYVAPVGALANPATIPWVMIVDVDDAISAEALSGEAFALDGDMLYLRTAQEAPRYKVISIDLTCPEIERARTIVPESEAVVQDIRLAGGRLIVKDFIAGRGRLRRVELESGKIQSIDLPMEGAITHLATEPASGEIVFQLSSWTVSPRIHRALARDGQAEDTGWLGASPVDFSGVETHELLYRSKDGTMVPLSIMHAMGMRRDGRNPTILSAYGSYGVSMEPTFQPTLLAWLERGGLYAVAHVRGGGECGKEWHQAGRGLNKQNTIDDFIGAAEYLIGEGYTRPPYLAARGSSAAGVPLGGALVERPDLWAAMVMHAPVINFLRLEVGESGPNNVPEFGSIAEKEGFLALHAIDAYCKIVDGVTYPAILVTIGVNDPRVPCWHATKLVARLQAATSSGKPVMLRVEAEGGHGLIGATRGQVREELADTFAFLLCQCRGEVIG